MIERLPVDSKRSPKTGSAATVSPSAAGAAATASPSTASPSESSAGPSRGSVERQALRGLSYSEGQARLAPAPEPKGPGLAGSAMVYASAGERELTAGTFREQKIGLDLEHDQGTSIEDILRRWSDVVETESRRSMHPVLAEVGDLGAAAKSSGKKHGVFVGNGNYEHEASVSTEGSMRIATGFKARGYETESHRDLTAPAMQDVFEGALSSAKAGDSEAVSFYGHGNDDRLLGVDHSADAPDAYPQARLGAAISAAARKGVHVRAIVYACHPGGVARKVLDDEARRLGTSQGAAETWVERVAAVQMARERLLRVESECRDSLAQISAKADGARRRALQAQDPDQKARLEAYVRTFESEWAEERAEMRERLSLLWEKSILAHLETLSGLVAAADGKARVAIPKELELQTIDAHDGRFTFGAVFDMMMLLENRLLALATKPSQDEPSP